MTYLGASVRILSRNDRDVSSSFPDLVAAAALLGLDRVILDGEIVALDARGAPSFDLLQNRVHVRAPGRMLVRSVPRARTWALRGDTPTVRVSGKGSGRVSMAGLAATVHHGQPVVGRPASRKIQQSATAQPRLGPRRPSATAEATGDDQPGGGAAPTEPDESPARVDGSMPGAHHRPGV